MQLPCRHVFAVKAQIPEARLIPLHSLCHEAYRISAMEATWANTCQVPDLSKLKPDNYIVPPLPKVPPQGRKASGAGARDGSAGVDEGAELRRWMYKDSAGDTEGVEVGMLMPLGRRGGQSEMSGTVDGTTAREGGVVEQGAGGQGSGLREVDMASALYSRETESES